MGEAAANYPTPAERLKEVTDKLEQGVKDLFESSRYTDYLKTMSRFHRYSCNNVLLISLQCPWATRVAGFHTWRKDFGRTVKRGEKGIRILAPCTYQTLVERDKLDPATNLPVMGTDGRPARETVLVRRQSFKVATVFDVSQTEGKELPSLCVGELAGDVEQYGQLSAALEELSPVPIHYRFPFPSAAKGCYSHMEQCVYVRPHMSQVQTFKTMVHEVSHAKRHALPVENGVITGVPEKDRRTREVEAESIAYVVCQHFGVDTSDYSFGYIAGWSKGRELEELKSSLSCICETAAELIDGIESRCPDLFPKPFREESVKINPVYQR